MNQNMGYNQYGGGYRPPQKNSNQNIALWVCVGLLVTVLLFGMLFIGFYLAGMIGGTTASEVPDVVGFKLTDAVKSLEEAGYECNKIFEGSNNVPEDHIIRQSPESGTILEQGEEVTLFISSGKTPPMSTAAPSTTSLQTPAPPAVSYLASGTYLVNTYSNSGIYVRAQASTQSGKVAYIAAGDTGTKLTYIDSVNAFDSAAWKWYTWYYVKHPNGSYGYVRSDVVRISTGNSTTTSSQKSYLVNAFSNSAIYVRSQASTNSAQVILIPAGNTSIKLEYLGSTSASDGTWYYVKLPNGSYGYVRSDVVRWW